MSPTRRSARPGRRAAGPGPAGGGPARARRASRLASVEERALPVVRELHRIASTGAPPAARLDGALEVLFGAYGSASGLAALLLDGWLRAASDKQARLTMAWLSEQARLCLEDILRAGADAGAFRARLDAAAVAGVILQAAEGCLLRAGSGTGSVEPARVAEALRALVTPDP